MNTSIVLTALLLLSWSAQAEERLGAVSFAEEALVIRILSLVSALRATRAEKMQSMDA